MDMDLNTIDFTAFESSFLSVNVNLSTFKKAEPIKSQEEIRLEWLLQRWGRCTASNYHKLMTVISKPNDLPAGAKTYLNKIVSELLTDPIDIDDHFVSKAMQWGIDHELEAIQQFEDVFCNGRQDVKNIGGSQSFNQYEMYFGGTPDGILSGHPIEVKCPDSVTHIDYLSITDADTLKAIKPEYYWQLFGNCQALDNYTGFFISYDPRLKDQYKHLRLHYAQIDFSNADQELLEIRQYLAAEYIEKRLAEFEKIKNNK